MLIDVAKLKRSPGMVQSYSLEETLDPLKSGSNTIEFPEPLKVEVRAVNSGDRIVLTAQVRSRTKMQCSRCLEDYSTVIEASFEREYRMNTDSGEADQELEVIKGDYVDLKEPVIESILLELPMKQVCEEQCKGLCNLCGINLNTERCDCEKDDIDPRLEALKKLLKS